MNSLGGSIACAPMGILWNIFFERSLSTNINKSCQTAGLGGFSDKGFKKIINKNLLQIIKTGIIYDKKHRGFWGQEIR